MEAEAHKHYNKYVAPHVAEVEYHLSIMDVENNHWPDDVEFKLVGVTSYVVKLDHQWAMEQDKKQLSDTAKATKWPYNWSWG